MKMKIAAEAKALEAAMGIKVLLTCETGPHAWGFAAPNDPHIIGMIYMHPKDWYISLEPKKDQLNWSFNSNQLHFEGWDLRKYLNLMQRSNSAFLEYINAPCFYAVDSFRDELLTLVDEFYAPIKVMYNHLCLIKNFLEETNRKDSHCLSAICTTIRSALICRWILVHNHSFPLNVFEILNELPLASPFVSEIINLMEQRKIADKQYIPAINPEIMAFFVESIAQCELQMLQLHGAQNKNHDLNSVFLKWLNKNDMF